MTSNYLRTALAGILALGFAISAHAADQFRISVIRESRSTDLIKVGKNWRKDLPKRMLVTLRVGKDIRASAVKVKAYFYDKDDKLVFTDPKPNPIWTATPRGIEEVLLPDTLERGKTIDVYFALPEELEAKKWKTMLVVFGDSTEMAARSRPASAIDRLKFPEEKIAKKEKE